MLALSAERRLRGMQPCRFQEQRRIPHASAASNRHGETAHRCDEDGQQHCIGNFGTNEHAGQFSGLPWSSQLAETKRWFAA